MTGAGVKPAKGPAAGDNRIRVLFVHYGDEWIRGSERCLLDLLANIDQTRFAARLWCNASVLAREAEALGVPTQVSPFRILFGWDPPRFAVRDWRRQVREAFAIVREHGTQLLHSNSAAPVQWLIPVARSRRIPLLAYLLAPYLQRERMTLGLHHATLAVGVTTGCVEGLVEDGVDRSRTRTIYCGVDPKVWARGDEAGLRTRLGIPPTAVTLTRVGSLIHRKGVDVMLRTLARLRLERPQCHLLVVGDGPDRATLEAMARDLGVADCTHFLGYVDASGAVLRDATDIVVSPARVEGFGLTVIEGGLAGKPVVATDTTGMREIIQSGENGIIVPVEDEDALLHALQELVDRPQLRAVFGEKLRATVEKRFLISTFVRGFEDTYAELIGHDRRELGWTGTWGPMSVYLSWLRGMVRRRMGTRPS